MRNFFQKGLTLVELLIAMSIMVTLLSLATINLVGSKQAASLSTTSDVLVADLKQQQVKAMVGDTEGRANSDSYGIHFDSNRYVLYHGTYSSNDSSNTIINLDSNMQFTISGFEISFARISGEISSSVNVLLKDTATNMTKTIQLNKYGVITGIN